MADKPLGVIVSFGKFLFAAVLVTGVSYGEVPNVMGCTQMGVVDRQSTFLFLHASINALAQAEQALADAMQFDAERERTADATGATNVMTSMMTHIKLSSGGYLCAMQLMNCYSTSKDKFIKTAAETLAEAYKEHVQLNDMFLQSLLRWREFSEHPEKIASLLSDIEVARTGAWKTLEDGITLALLTASRHDADEKRRHLKITRQERQELVDTALHLFPGLRDEKSDKELDKPTFLADI